MRTLRLGGVTVLTLVVAAVVLTVGAANEWLPDLQRSGGTGADRQGSGNVLHVRAVRSLATTMEEVRERHELWYDSASGDTLHEVKDEAGAQLERTIVVGQVLEFQRGSRSKTSRVTAPTEDSPMLQVGNALLAYRRLFADPTVSARAESEAIAVQLNDEAALKLGGGEMARDLGLDASTVWIAPDTLLPLRIDSMESGVHRTETWEYEVVETLATAPEGIFHLPDTSDSTGSTERYFERVTDEAFPDYPVYYLGESYLSLPIFAMVARDHGPGRRWFHVVYADDTFDAEGHRGRSITVETRAPESPTAMRVTGNAPIGPPRVTRRTDDYPRSGAFALDVDGVLVRIMGIEEHEVEVAIEQMERLNAP